MADDFFAVHHQLTFEVLTIVKKDTARDYIVPEPQQLRSETFLWMIRDPAIVDGIKRASSTQYIASPYFSFGGMHFYLALFPNLGDGESSITLNCVPHSLITEDSKAKANAVAKSTELTLSDPELRATWVVGSLVEVYSSTAGGFTAAEVVLVDDSDNTVLVKYSIDGDDSEYRKWVRRDDQDEIRPFKAKRIVTLPRCAVEANVKVDLSLRETGTSLRSAVLGEPGRESGAVSRVGIISPLFVAGSVKRLRRTID